MPESENSKPMSFLKHLAELRGCILRSLAAILLGFVIAYVFSKQIYNLLLIPFNDAFVAVIKKDPNLIFTTVFEPFLAYLKISLVAGIFIASPYIFYELWKFIAPGLYKSEKKLIIPFVTFAVVSFVGGALFAYFLVFPIGFKFFLGYATEVIQPAIKVNDYLKISLSMLLVFGLVFEFPLIVLFLVYIDLLSAASLFNQWRYIVIGIALASAVFTPADPLSMILMMTCLILLYLVTLGLAYLIGRARRVKQ